MPGDQLARFPLVGSFSALASTTPAGGQDASPVDENLAPDASPAAAEPPLPPGFTSVAAGLDNARGLAFGPDGVLYVAEAGHVGEGPCVQGPEGGRECYGTAGAITRIDLEAGTQERVVDGLRSRAAEDGSQATGPHDVAFQGDLL